MIGFLLVDQHIPLAELVLLQDRIPNEKPRLMVNSTIDEELSITVLQKETKNPKETKKKCNKKCLHTPDSCYSF